jgi:hypothetical protein
LADPAPKEQGVLAQVPQASRLPITIKPEPADIAVEIDLR